MNDVKDMGEHVKVLRLYEAFVIKIKNQNEFPIDSDVEGELEGEDEDCDSDFISGKFSQAPSPFLTTNNQGQSKEELPFYNSFPPGHILASFNSSESFVDLLRAIEAENLFVISLS